MASIQQRVRVGVHLLAIVALVLAASAAASPRAGTDNGAERVAVIGVFHDSVSNPRAEARDIERRHNGELTFVYEHALKGFAGEFPRNAIQGIERDRRVDYVEFDQAAYAFGHTLDEVPTGVDRVEVDKKLSLDNGSAISYAGTIDIAILDTGIDDTHPDLNVVGGTDCARGGPFNNGGCKDGLPGDGHGHGTHVAGTAAAIDHSSGLGVNGMAPGADLWAVKVLGDDGSGWISWIVAGIDWVTAQADTIEVANMSLGCECDSDSLDDALTNSTSAGVVYAVAAGNSGKNASTFSPANHDQVITVSAMADFDGMAGAVHEPTCRDDVGDDDTFAAFSNYGDVVDLAAPGVCIKSTVPGDGYASYSGTSMSSPHVAGAAALYILEKGLSQNSNRWSKVLTGLTGNGWSVGQDDDCGFDGGKSSEPFLMLDACDIAGVTGDSPVVSWKNPADGAEVSGTVTVQIDATDTEDDTGTLTVEWQVDGGTSQTATYSTSGYYEDSWDTTAVDDGDHTLEAQATDSDGNVTAATITVATENTDDPPTVSLVNPQDGDTVKDAVTVQVDAADDRDDSGTLTVQWRVNTGDWQSAGYNTDTGYYEASWDTNAVADGDYQLDARATDSGSNTSTLATITVTVANTTPTATVDSITYDSWGGPDGKKHLGINVTVVDDGGKPISGASVSIELKLDSDGDGYDDGSWPGTGTTDSNGTVRFELKNAPPGCYTTTVTDLVADGFEWDGNTPSNSTC